MSEIPEARPASTVILLRDTARGIETLMLRRNKALAFAGGLWVFPGGSIDAEDIAAADGEPEGAARVAAAREAQEEAAVAVDPERMELLSHWTTPVEEPKRFATWIFAAPVAAGQEVMIDGSEIHDARWQVIDDVLDEHRAGEMAMLPPTFTSLVTLSGYESVDALLAGVSRLPVPEVLPKMIARDRGFLVLYRGDAGYEDGDPSVKGARHRTEMSGQGWLYRYESVSDYPPIVPLDRLAVLNHG